MYRKLPSHTSLACAICLLCLSAVPHVLNAQSRKNKALKAEINTLVQHGWELVYVKNFPELLTLTETLGLKTRTAYGENSSAWADYLLFAGIAYAGSGKTDSSESCYLRARHLYAHTRGKTSSGYIASGSRLAILYNSQGMKGDSAMALYDESWNLAHQNREFQSSLEFVIQSNNHGLFCLNSGRLEKAELLFSECMASQAAISKEDFRYMIVVQNLITTYYLEKKFENAENLLLEIIALVKEKNGTSDPFYSGKIYFLAELYDEWGRQEEAKKHYLQAKNGFALNPGRQSLEYADATANYGYTCYRTEDFREAIKNIEEALALYARLNGIVSVSYARGQINLADAYIALGRFEVAEKNLLEAVQKQELLQYRGEKVEIWRPCNDLGYLYQCMGNLQKAEQMYRRSLQEMTRLNDTLSVERATIIANLAGLLLDSKIYPEVDTLLRQSLTMFDRLDAKSHPNYAKSLQNLGLLHYYLAEYDEAENRYSQALDAMGRSQGKNHPAYAEIVFNLACLKTQAEKFEEAENLFRQAGAVWQRSEGKDFRHHVNLQQNLALVNNALQRYETVDSILSTTSPLQQTLLKDACKHLSEQELAEYLQLFVQNYHQYLSFTQNRPVDQVSTFLPSICLENAWFYKGFLLQTAVRIKNKLQKDSLAREQMQQLAAIRQQATKGKRSAELDSIANVLEKQLTRRAGELENDTPAFLLEQAKNKLQPGEALVEFIGYKYYDPAGTPTGAVQYAALVLRTDTKAPLFVPLFEQSQLEQLPRSPLPEQYYRERYWSWKAGAPSLYSLIWMPLEPSLSGIKTIYFAPDGLLHRLNLAAIRDPEKRYLGDRYHMVQLAGTQNFNQSPAVGTTDGDIILFGAMDYNLGISEPSGNIAGTREMTADSSMRAGAWAYLPGARKEINAIETLCSNYHWDVRKYTGSEATEAQFKQIGKNGPAPRVIHLATHGFFSPDPHDSTTGGLLLAGARARPATAADNPMLRSGLVMSGANFRRTADLHGNVDDGLLTAYEIAQMDLSGTELVVLSACDTGLGEIAGNEGVFGLQRAFKIAGVRYVLMSLWSVDDAVTQQLMQAFYRNRLQNGLDPRSALSAAQAEIRALYPSPYYWAAFVVME